MPALNIPRDEAFAQEVAKGALPIDAFRKITGEKRAGDGTQSSRLFKKVEFRISEIQSASCTETTLDMKERRELLAERARADDVKDNDLVSIILADAKLAGELTEKVDVSGRIQTTPEDVLAAVRMSPAIRGLPLPANVPGHS